MNFIINNKNYNDHVVVGTHKVNNQELFEPWTDATYREHQVKKRDQIIGTLDLFFRSPGEFSRFHEDVENAKDKNTGTVNITVSVNNLNKDVKGDFFITYELTRTQDGSMEDFYEQFSVNIKEA